MKTYLHVFLATLALVFAGCLETKPRSFFANDGIQVGTATKEADGSYRLPIKFETKITHSGQWIYDVKTKITNDVIYVTAVFTTPPDLKESRYPGFVVIRGSRAGNYPVRYQDPDGQEHFLAIATLP